MSYFVVAIKDMSAGNDTIGEAWQETKIFSSENTLNDVMQWVGKRRRIVLTIPAGSEDAFNEINLIKGGRNG